jgi:bifunctional UDP-N-acetylglucosamine pyrophosphorylase/glucosamine-1-phosphate N-acetyltransferase
MNIKTIILAAGQGTRMRSSKPKVLHKIADRALLHHVYDTSAQLENNSIVIIYGHGGERVKDQLKSLDANWIEQKEQLGTGHAVQQAEGFINDEDKVLILYGDVPLLKKSTIDKLLDNVSQHSIGLLTVVLDNPKGYGRIVRADDGTVLKIVEEKDTTTEEKLITEGNTGIIATPGNLLKEWLSKLESNNAQKEFYLTDIIEMAVKDGIQVKTNQAESMDEVLGVNDRSQLAHLERVYQLEQAQQLMAQGITLRDPARIDVRGKFEKIGQDIEMDINVLFEGTNSIGNNVSIGANSIVKNSIIGDDVEILANCIIEDAVVGERSRIGPFARLRPQAELASEVHIGNFVEIKKSTVATGSKINHLSYIGDSTIGSGVNVGAGTITCNYDGVNKFRTVIEDGAFIGSDTQLIAPVTVGKGATIGAGSTISKDTPKNQLTLSRAKQISIKGWQKPVKNS